MITTALVMDLTLIWGKSPVLLDTLWSTKPATILRLRVIVLLHRHNTTTNSQCINTETKDMPDTQLKLVHTTLALSPEPTLKPIQHTYPTRTTWDTSTPTAHLPCCRLKPPHSSSSTLNNRRFRVLGLRLVVN